MKPNSEATDTITLALQVGTRIAQWYNAGLWAGRPGVQVPSGAGNFTQHRVQTGSGTHSASYPIQWVPGALSLEVKRPGREADHSSPPSSGVKNVWNYTSAPAIRLHGVVLS
jgi:hypothetical protein